MSLINRTNNVLRRRRLQINGEMLDDIRPTDLEEFGVGASIQRRKLLRVVKRAQEEDVDVSNFTRSDLLSFAKRVREIQRERLKDVKGVDLSFLDRPLLEDLDSTDTVSDKDSGAGMFRMFLIAVLVSIVAIGYRNGHYDNLASIAQEKFAASFASPSPSPSHPIPSPTPRRQSSSSSPSPAPRRPLCAGYVGVPLLVVIIIIRLLMPHLLVWFPGLASARTHKPVPRLLLNGSPRFSFSACVSSFSTSH